jgi:hypothetical protein
MIHRLALPIIVVPALATESVNQGSYPDEPWRGLKRSRPMAQGSSRTHERDGGVRYEVVVDLGTNPVMGRRRQRSTFFRTKRAAQAALATMLTDIDKGTAVDRSRQTVAQMMQYW